MELDNGGAILVEGETGMGKSRLAQEAKSIALGFSMICLYGAADSAEKTTPYFGFRNVSFC